MVTINDVARKAGVSIMTVSNAINGRSGKMSRDTLKRVEDAVAALGYQRNSIAHQLRSGRSKFVGLLVPSITNPSYAVLAREVESFLHQRHGLRLIVASTYRDREIERSFLEDLRAHGVRGCIVISSGRDHKRFDPAVGWGMAIANYDASKPARGKPTMDYVSVDNARCSLLAVEHLAALGHRTVALVKPSGITASRTAKTDGFLAAARARGLEALVLEAEAGSGYADAELAELGQSLAEAVVASPARPTGVIAINDMMAFGLIKGLRQRGVRAPQDMSIIGMDALPLNDYVEPSLTSVKPPVREMASLLVDRVVARVEDRTIEPQEFLFEPTLIPGGSVAPPSGGNR